MESEKWSAVKLDGVSVMGHTGAHCSKEYPSELNQKEARCQAHSCLPSHESELISSIIGPKCTAEIIICHPLQSSLLMILLKLKELGGRLYHTWAILKLAYISQRKLLEKLKLFPPLHLSYLTTNSML